MPEKFEEISFTVKGIVYGLILDRLTKSFIGADEYVLGNLALTITEDIVSYLKDNKDN